MTYLGEWQIDDLLTFSVTPHTFATGNLEAVGAAFEKVLEAVNK